MNVAAVIVTRGDVDLAPVLESLPVTWEVVVWDNSGRVEIRRAGMLDTGEVYEDVAVYGRYLAIQLTRRELIYVQDDDCVLEDPRALLRAWSRARIEREGATDHLVTNMPAAFRHSFYEEHDLVGFGAVFHRDLPQRAFDRLTRKFGQVPELQFPHWNRTCDIAVSALAPVRVRIDTPYADLPWASADNRMWRQPTHREERGEALVEYLAARRA